MTEKTRRSLLQREAELTIVIAARRAVLLRSLVRITQRIAARTMQRFFRARVEQPNDVYRELSEIDRLRMQVRSLRSLVERRDAWIFRALILLRRYAPSDQRLAQFVAASPDAAVFDASSEEEKEADRGVNATVDDAGEAAEDAARDDDDASAASISELSAQ